MRFERILAAVYWLVMSVLFGIMLLFYFLLFVGGILGAVEGDIKGFLLVGVCVLMFCFASAMYTIESQDKFRKRRVRKMRA